MNRLELWPEIPDLAAISMLASSIDVVAELLDDLHPELLQGAGGDLVVHTLMRRLTACSAALDAYHAMRVGDVVEAEACRRAAIDAGLLDDDIF